MSNIKDENEVFLGVASAGNVERAISSIKDILSNRDGIVAAWKSPYYSEKYKTQVIFVVYDDEETGVELLDYDLMMSAIPIEADTGVLFDFIMRSPMLAGDLGSVERQDLLLKKDGYVVPNDAIPVKITDDTANDTKMKRHLVFAKEIERDPSILDEIKEDFEQHKDKAPRGTEIIYRLWDAMLDQYPVNLILAFITSNTPKMQQMALSSPFLLSRVLDRRGVGQKEMEKIGARSKSLP